MFANGLQPWHIIVLVIVLIVLFGAKRLPDAARGIGKSMRIFKAEAKSLRDEHEAESGKAENGEVEEPVKQQLQQARQETAEPKATTPAEQPGSTDTQR
ncbi:MAG: Sec-independent protein translocase subunit TatA [Sciscionella sp.]